MLTRPDGTQFSWDYEGRLSQAVLPNGGGTVTFHYDPFGKRIQKSGPLGTTNYFYDGPNILETMDQNGNPLASYVGGGEIDDSMAETVSGALAYYEQDGNNTATSLTDVNGSPFNTYTFDSFGNLTASTAAITNPLQYTGREFDQEIGIYYYRARYYDETVGRFISEDPIEFKGEIDFYAYVKNNPTTYIDPLGLIHYNNDPPKTVPVTGQTLADLQCTEKCLKCLTNNPRLDLLITGGAEQTGHKGQSFHYSGQAVDIAGPLFNPVTTSQVFACASNCGFGAGQYETFTKPTSDHWHLQLVPGNGVPALPKSNDALPPCCQGGAH